MGSSSYSSDYKEDSKKYSDSNYSLFGIKKKESEEKRKKDILNLLSQYATIEKDVATLGKFEIENNEKVKENLKTIAQIIQYIKELDKNSHEEHIMKLEELYEKLSTEYDEFYKNEKEDNLNRLFGVTKIKLTLTYPPIQITNISYELCNLINGMLKYYDIDIKKYYNEENSYAEKPINKSNR